MVMMMRMGMRKGMRMMGMMRIMAEQTRNQICPTLQQTLTPAQLLLLLLKCHS